jgi:chromate transporter
LVAISGPLIPRIRRSPVAAAFLDGVTVASIALIAWVLVVLGRAVLIDPISIGIAVASLALLIRFRVNAAWLIAGGGLLGAFNR